MPCSGDPKPYNWGSYDASDLIKHLNANPDSFTWCGNVYYKDPPKPLRRTRKTTTTVVEEVDD